MLSIGLEQLRGFPNHLRPGQYRGSAGKRLPGKTTEVYHVLRDQKPYQDLGADYFDHLDTRRLANQSVKRLEALGFQVTLRPREEMLT